MIRRSSKSLGAFTLVEMLIVITIIAFVAGALVVASNGVMKKANNAKTQALVQRLTTACTLFKDDFGYYPPDDWPYTDDSSEGVQFLQAENPSGIALWPNANLMLRLLYSFPEGQKQYLSASQAELRGQVGADLTRMGFYGTQNFASKVPGAMGLVVVDGWGRPLFYRCNTADPLINPKTGSARPTPGYMSGSSRIAGLTAGMPPPAVGGAPRRYLPIRNAKGGDIFSCGVDGLTSINNQINDNQDVSGVADEDAECDMIGEAADDINNWASR